MRMVLGKTIKYITLYSAVLILIVTGNFIFSNLHAQCTGSETPTTNVTSNYNGDDVSCAGACDGEITITMTGGSVYGYQIFHQNTSTYFPGPTADDFQGSNVFTALCQGDYDVTVLDSAIVYIPGLLYGECTGFETVSGSQGLVASFLGPSPPSCKDSCDGSVFINSTGGNTTGFLRYEMPVIGLDTLINPNGVRFFQVDNLCTGSQSFTVTDVNGCSVTEIENAIVEPPTFYGTISLTDALCDGDCNGSAEATPVGGNGGPFEYLWDDIPTSGGLGTSNIVNGLCENTTYSLHLEDSKDCPFDTTFNTIDVTPIAISISSAIDASCSYSCDGSITISVSGGSGTYASYEWYGGSVIGAGVYTGVDALTNNTLCPDSSYYVVVTDDNGCVHELLMPVLTSPSDIVINGVTSDILCNGDGNGSITIDVTGGNGTLNSAWTTVIPGSGIIPGDEDQTGLSGGTYEIIVTDDNGCQDSATYVIDEPAAIFSDGTISNISCSGQTDGSITLNLSGGNGALNTTWTSSDPTFLDPNTDNLINLDSGSYTLNIIDDNGCLYDTTFVLSTPTPIYASATKTDVSCYGFNNGSISLNPSSVNASGTICGTADEGFDVVLTAPPGAVFTNVSFASYGLPTGSCGNFSIDPSCHSNSSLTFVENLLIGNNTATINANNTNFGDPCVGTLKRLYIEANWELSNSFSFSWTATNGFTSNDEDIALLDTGLYSVTITELSTLCTKDTSITINQPDSIDISGTVTNILCDGDDNGTININVIGGNAPVNWSWTSSDLTFVDPGSNATILDPLNGGTYTVSVVDNLVCTKDTTFTINEPNTIFSNGTATNVSCSGQTDGSITLNLSGGTGTLNTTWTSSDPTFVDPNTDDLINLDSGSYTLNIIDDNGCLYDTTFVLSTPAPIYASATKTDVQCNGSANGEIDLTTSNGNAPYQWSWTATNGFTSLDEDLTLLDTGTYSVTITDFLGCTKDTSITINQPDSIDISGTVTNILCDGDDNGTININVIGGNAPVNWSWTSSDPTFVDPGSNATILDPLNGGTYTISVVDNLACTKDTTFTIDEPNAITPTIVIDSNASCNGASDAGVTATAVGGSVAIDYSYLWDDPAAQNTATAINLSAGTYEVTITDDNGCNTTENVKINEPDLIYAIPLLLNGVSCNGLNDASITSIGVGGSVVADYQYSWDDPSTQNTATATNLATGTYTITITDDNGCIGDSSITITEPDVLTATHTIDSEVSCFGLNDGQATVSPTGGTSPYTYLWSDGQTSATATNLAAGTYTCTVTDDGTKQWNLNYIENFQGVVGAEWTENSTNTYRGNTILGEFNSNATGLPTLNLAGLPAHDSIRVVLEMYAFDTWNGNSTQWGPDLWTLAVDNDTLLHTTFSGRNSSQSFPDNYPAIYPEGEGAFADSIDKLNSSHDNTLKFFFNYSSLHSNNTASINLTDQLDQSIGNESWGIDNIRIYLYEASALANCSHVETIIITEPDELEATATKISDVTCFEGNEGSAIGSAVGGTVSTDYQYSWNDISNQTTSNATGLIAGTYQLNITDDNGCEDSATVIINEPTEIITSSLINNVSCNSAGDGSIDLTTSGGSGTYVFDWDNDGTGDQDDAEDLFSLGAGTYCITIIDQAQPLCQLDTCFEITEASAINISETITNVACNGDSTGAINIIVAGGVVATDYQYSWVGINTGFISNSSNISTLVADQYFITVTDDVGCQDSATYDLIENNDLVITPTSTDASCGLSNGSASIAVTGGIAAIDYQYSWVDNTNSVISTNNNISGVSAGIFVVTVTDDVNCQDSLTININDLSQSTITIDSIKHESCAGDQDGLITVSITVSPGPGTLVWTGPAGFTDPGGNNTTIDNLGNGQYIATLTDGAGCTLQEIIDINEAQSLTLNAVTINPSCFGDNNGEIDLFVSGGNVAVDYTYDWDNDGTGDNDDTQDLTGLGGGSFSISIYDDAGCSINQTYNLIEPTELTGSTTANLTGCGLNDGSAQVTVNGGTVATDYTYLWTDGSGNQIGANNTITSQAAGCYNIDVTDDNGCIFSDIACISNPTGPSISLDQIDSVDCYAGTNGAIFITVTGVNNPFIYNWQTVTSGSPDNLEDLQNVNEGSYSITVTDTLGCVTAETYVVYQPDSIEITNVTTDLSCFGDNTGEIDLSIIGGTMPYTVSWSGPSGFVSVNEDISGLTQGSYQISGSDLNNCPLPTTIIDVDEPILLSISLSSTPTACNQPTGSVTISGTGGTVATDYTYELTDISGVSLSSSSTIENLDQGQYIGFIYDDNSCVATDTILIDQTDDPVITLDNIEDADCAGNATGSIFITVTGDASPFTFLWSGTVSPDPAHQTTEDFEDWFAGTFEVSVTDTNGCSSILNNLTIDQPISLFATENITHPLCSGESTGSVTINPSGGTNPVQIDWTENGINIGSGATINTLDSGAYVYTITDFNNCIYSNTVNLLPPNALSLTGTTTPSTCGNTDGAASVGVSGGTAIIDYTYSWSNVLNGTNLPGSVNSQTNLISGIYQVIVMDDNGCIDSTNITVSDSDGPSITYTSSNIACFGVSNGTIDLTITGNGPPYTFVWTGPVGFVDPGLEDLTGLEPGNYSVFVTDPANCSGAENITVGGPNDDIQIQSTVTNLNCYNDSSGAISINIIGGTAPYNINWEGPNGFSSTDEDLININDVGEYIISVTDFNGCPDSGPLKDTFDITQPTEIILDTNIVTPTCDSTDGLLYVTVTGGNISTDYSYVWDDISTPEFNKSFDDSLVDIGAGNYEITVTDDNGCSSSEVIAISDLNGPSLSAVSTDVDCVGDDDGTIDLTISPIGSYGIDWDNDGTGDNDDNEDLILLAAGNYNVIVEDLTTGCKSALSVDINVANTLAISLTPTSLNCNSDTDGAIATDVTGGTSPYDFDWSLNGFSVSTDEDPTNLAAGNYIVTLTDDNGCQKIDSAEIIEPSILVLTGSSVNSSCGQADGEVSVIVSGGTSSLGYGYSWFEISSGYPGSPVGSGNATEINLLSGSYQVVVTDDNNCVDSIPVAISDDNAPSVSYTVTDVECFGDSTGVIQLNVTGIDPFTYSWTGPIGFVDPGSADSIGGLISGGYSVVVTDDNGCTKAEIITVDGPINGLSIDSSVTHLTCNGDSTGAIDIQINGGTSPFQTVWSGPSGYSSFSEDLNNLDTGEYVLNITDDQGCQLIGNIFNVTQPDSIEISGTIISPTCNAADGSISVIASGGTIATNYQYSWDNLSTPAYGIGILTSLSNIGAGNYQITVTDDNNCSSSKVFAIANANAPTLAATVTHIDCNGESNGNIDLTITGTSSYTIDWDNDGVGDADDDEDLNNLSAGTYSVTVYDLSTGCVSVLSEDVIMPDPISIGATPQNILCNGDNNGSITIFLSGGTGDLIPEWTTLIPGNGIIPTDTSQNGLGEGTYKIVVTDVNNCKDSSTYIILEADTIEITSTLSHVQCADSLNGEIVVIGTGGTGTLVPTWASSNPSFIDPNTISLSGLDSGNYFLSLVDDNGCVYDTSFSINKPNSIFANANVSSISCHGTADATIELNTSGGNGSYNWAWSGPSGYSSTEDTILNLDTGSYQLNIIDLSGCSIDTLIEIIQPDELSIIANINNVGCFDDTTGNIKITVGGGNGNYTYDWDNDGVGDFDDLDTIFDLADGNYSVSIIDDNGCTIDSTFTITEQPQIIISSTIVNNLCFNDSLGEINPIISGGTGTLIFDWSSSSGFTNNNDTITTLHNDTFNLNIIDDNLCSIDTFFVVSSPNELFANITLTDANCGLLDGSASANPLGGTVAGTYLFDWDNDGTGDNDDNASISNLLAGTYSLTITDDNNCSVDTSINIANTSGPVVGLNSITNPSCHKGVDGEIDVTISGGNQPYQIYWNPNQYAQNTTLSNLSAGEYIISVIDQVGCAVSDTFTVNEAPAILINNITTNSTCGICDGTATATISGGNVGATFNTVWSDGSVGNLATSLCPGVYSVTTTDNNGCIETEEFSISDDGLNITETINSISPSCPDLSDGSIDVTVSGGTSPYNYLWVNDGATSNVLNNIGVGDYHLIITDNNGCSKTITTSLSPNSDSIISSAFIIPANCGANDGTIILTSNGGTAPYVYSWNNGINSNTLNNVASGQYSVTITDFNGCTINETYGLSNFNDLDIQLTTTSVSCFNGNNGEITASVSGNNGTITSTWFDINSNNIGSGNSINSIAAGTYIYHVNDDLTNCSQYVSTVVEEGDQMMSSLSNNIAASCSISCDGQATVVVAGGLLPYTYQWASGSVLNVGSNLCAGNQAVLVTDANGCEVQQTVYIEENNDINGIPLTVDASCGSCDGQATISPTGGSGIFSISWFDGIVATSHANLCAGVHGYQITDNTTSCEYYGSVSISNTGGPNNQIVNTVNPSCYGSNDGSASVIASGGTPPYAYYWVPGGHNSPVLSNASAGNYFLEVVDENNCVMVVPVTLADPPAPTVESVIIDASCNSNTGSISIAGYQGSGPYTYNWSGPNNYISMGSSINGLAAGQYQLSVSDNNGCISEHSFSVNTTNSLSVSLSATNVTCFNGANGSINSVINNGSGNYGYSWSNNASSNNITGLTSGSYGLTVTDLTTNCVANNFIHVSQPDSISFSVSVIGEPNCYGNADGNANIIVSGGNNGFLVTWPHNGSSGFSQTGLAAGNYDALITDQNGCQTTQSITITQPDSIQIITDQIINAYCQNQNDGEIYISVIGGTDPYSYMWNDTTGALISNNEDVSGLLPDTYIITVIDNNLCTNNDTIVVSATNVILASAGSDINICVGDCMDILGSGSGSNNLTYQWNILDSLAILSNDSLIVNYCFSDTADISFELTVSDQNCNDTDVVTVIVHDLPEVDAGLDINDLYGSYINLGGNPTGPSFASFLWSPTTNFISLDDSSSSNPEIELLTDGIYVVTATDTNGCVNTDTVSVILIPEITYPSGFSPNGDMVNDEWTIDQIEQFPNCTVEIYNRWGTLLFKSTGYNDKWSGMYKNKLLPIGTYYYIIELNDPKFPDPITGPVTIIR